MNTHLVFGNEHYGSRNRISGVYMIVFDSQYYYIGSSVDLKRRFGSWKFNLIHGVLKNSKIKFIINEVSTVNFYVLEYCDESMIKEVENAQIQFSINDIDNLNIESNPINANGVTFRYNQAIKIKKEITPSKKVGQFDINGNLIIVHDSLGKAAIFNGISKKRSNIISKIALGKKGMYKNFVFKFMGNDGNFIERVSTKRVYIRKSGL